MLALPHPYDHLLGQLSAFMPKDRLITDPLRTLAYGTDASCYRLVPKIVVLVETEGEVVKLLKKCRTLNVPVTFRAAGTSLSGQAISDSVLVVMGDGWDRCEVMDNGRAVRVQPGVIGAEVNRVLAEHKRKIGPDPASINTAKIGGIAANNASGMCCGTAQNSYNTLKSMRLILADGTVLDTGDEQSRQLFVQSHKALLDELERLGKRVREDEVLSARIAQKFKIKNTTGYALNALIDYTDPIDILQHLMIGSEGTLGFISEITYHTVADHADRASALVLFADLEMACRAVQALKGAHIAAAEIMDRAALRSVADKPGMPDHIQTLGDRACALLVEVRGHSVVQLAAHRNQAEQVLQGIETLYPVEFAQDGERQRSFWNIRKGLFPAVGAVRETGTTVIIEDVAFPIEKLAQAALHLQRLFKEHGYDEAIIFGHALEGNLHFVFTQDFNTPTEIVRYALFMDDVVKMVVEEYDGSLKAEHGTGRNMAPFVELEWGRDAYTLMQVIKHLLDPYGLLNPGVILNDDGNAHLQNLKSLPAANALIDKCTECGFCEPKCPSKDLTLSPRQRIVGWREIRRRQDAGEHHGDGLEADYVYQGVDTCAACGLCATACPAGIEAGALTKFIRGQSLSPVQTKVGNWLADHYGLAMKAMGLGLRAADLMRGVLGSKAMLAMTATARKLSRESTPRWIDAMPRAAHVNPIQPQPALRDKVVYFPSCAVRTMGPSREDDSKPLTDVMVRVLNKAGFDVAYPDGMADLCCGQPFDSKGLSDAAEYKARELEAALRLASDDGSWPIVFDTSPCAFRMKDLVGNTLKIFDATEFLHDQVLPRLSLTKTDEPVALHPTCSTRKMGLEEKLKALAEACSEQVVIPPSVGCCGWAGDKGFTTPELNDHSLRHLKRDLGNGVRQGYSTSRTCEIGLSDKSGIPYRSIIYLLDECMD